MSPRRPPKPFTAETQKTQGCAEKLQKFLSSLCVTLRFLRLCGEGCLPQIATP